MESDAHKPEVAIFISSLEGGGAELMMCNLANAFVERGLHTDLLLTRRKGPYLSIVDKRVRLISFDVPRPLFAFPKLARYLRRNRPAALLSALDHTNLIAVAARHLSRAPVRHVVSQRNNPSIKPSLRKEPFEILNYWLLGYGYRRADAVIAVSKGVAESLATSHRVPHDLIHVVYNAVEIPTARDNRGTVDHPWLLDDDVSVVLGAGRLTHQKGFDTLIRAFKRVSGQWHTRLVILGTGEDQASLRRLVHEQEMNDRVLFPGFVPNPWAWMAQADVFVLSSRWEGLPGVLLQAMASGTRVVSTDCPSGPAEILENGRWGRLVPVDNEAALAGAILQTLDDPNPPDVTARAAEFDLESMVEGYLQVLQVGTAQQNGSLDPPTPS